MANVWEKKYAYKETHTPLEKGPLARAHASKKTTSGEFLGSFEIYTSKNVERARSLF